MHRVAEIRTFGNAASRQNGLPQVETAYAYVSVFTALRSGRRCAGSTLPVGRAELTEWSVCGGDVAVGSAAQSTAASSAPNATASSCMSSKTSKLRSTISGL